MHRWSELFIPTLREAPADAEVASHKFLVRAGYIRQLAAGIYSYLFLGNRSFNKIMGIVREEMDKIGQEFYLPALHPRELWEASGRWAVMGENLFRLKDRKGTDLCLGMTHEEVMTDIARKELRSYKQLPQIWYQIQSKFRDEPRPRSGLLRVRQFIMKDSYSFDIDAAGLDVSYKKHYETYCRIFDRCGLKYMVVEADSGAMGGKESHEFMVRTPAGEDLIVSCEQCNYAANMEKATSKLAGVEDLTLEGGGEPLEVHTPGMKTIEDVARFLGVSPKNKIKTLALMAEETDRQDSEDETAPGCPADARRSSTERSEAGLGRRRKTDSRHAGGRDQKSIPFASGISWTDWHRLGQGLEGRRPADSCCVDKALEGRKNLICGANKEDYHLKNVTPGRDFQPDGVCRSAQRNRGRSLPQLRSRAAHRYGRRNRPYLQAGLQVFGVDGRASA